MSIGSDKAAAPARSGVGLPPRRGVLAGVAVVVVAVGGGVALSRGEHSGGAQPTKAIVANGSTTGAPKAVATVGKQGAAGARANRSHLANRARSVQAPPSGTTSATGSPHGGVAASGAGAGSRSAVAEVRDPEEAKSFPLPASVHHARASSPSVAADAAIAPGAASDAEIRKELGEEARAKAQERAAQHRILTPVAGGFSVGGNGTIPIPTDVPEAIQRVIAGGNAIADFPYIWGGGHGSFVANGYDCSGSVSYALAAGGLLSSPLVSGDLASWGEPGPGRWITIYANAGHTFMSVDGMWFDTAGRSGPYASRWLVSTPSLVGYSVRHPPGF